MGGDLKNTMPEKTKAWKSKNLKKHCYQLIIDFVGLGITWYAKLLSSD